MSPAGPTCLIRNIGTLVTGDRARPLRRGVRIRDLPLTPERVWRALRATDRG